MRIESTRFARLHSKPFAFLKASSGCTRCMQLFLHSKFFAEKQVTSLCPRRHPDSRVSGFLSDSMILNKAIPPHSGEGLEVLFMCVFS